MCCFLGRRNSSRNAGSSLATSFTAPRLRTPYYTNIAAVYTWSSDQLFRNRTRKTGTLPCPTVRRDAQARLPQSLSYSVYSVAVKCIVDGVWGRAAACREKGGNCSNVPVSAAMFTIQTSRAALPSRPTNQASKLTMLHASSHSSPGVLHSVIRKFMLRRALPPVVTAIYEQWPDLEIEEKRPGNLMCLIKTSCAVFFSPPGTSWSSHKSKKLENFDLSAVLWVTWAQRNWAVFFFS